MSYDADERTLPYAATRVELHSNARFEALRDAFEQQVPPLSADETLGRLAEDGDWAAFTRSLAWEAPSGFVRLWTWHPTPLMVHAGSGTPSASYLVINHAIGARLFRHDPGALLYSPLRIELHAAREAGTVLSFDQPSAQLKGFGLNKVTQAGSELDRALGDLLEDLELPRPAVLRR